MEFYLSGRSQTKASILRRRTLKYDYACAIILKNGETYTRSSALALVCWCKHREIPITAIYYSDFHADNVKKYVLNFNINGDPRFLIR